LRLFRAAVSARVDNPGAQSLRVLNSPAETANGMLFAVQ
jgi:hypothetical protein